VFHSIWSQSLRFVFSVLLLLFFYLYFMFYWCFLWIVKFCTVLYNFTFIMYTCMYLYSTFSFIGNLYIFPLVSPWDIFSINKLRSERHITLPFGWVICLSDLGNMSKYYSIKYHYRNLHEV
jgi:hypothetical protein